MNIDTLFEDNNKNHFSYVTMFSKNLNKLLLEYIKEEFKDKVNLIVIDQDKISPEDIENIRNKSNVCISNDPNLLSVFNNTSSLLYQIVFDYEITEQYSLNIDFFDPLRNNSNKAYKPILNKSVVKDFEWFLNTNRIDYVNY